MAMRRQSDYQLPDELVQFAFEENVKNAGMILIRHLEQPENLAQIDELTPLQQGCMETAVPGVMRRLNGRLAQVERERNAEARAHRRTEPYPTLSAHIID
jgi:GH35 family endo-1,4-beta-xylanase